MPVFNRCDYAGGYRIEFDIAGDSIEFGGASYEAIEGFIAPEGSAGSFENPVCCSGCGAFEPSCDFGEFYEGCQQRVDVVGHDYPGVQGVEMAVGFASLKGFGYHVGDLRIGQPSGSMRSTVEGSVFFGEGFSIGQEGVPVNLGETSVESPVQEYRGAFGVEVGEAASVLLHSQGRRKRLPHSSGLREQNSLK
jgi:hypothetical protein